MRSLPFSGVITVVCVIEFKIHTVHRHWQRHIANGVALDRSRFTSFLRDTCEIASLCFIQVHLEPVTEVVSLCFIQVHKEPISAGLTNNLGSVSSSKCTVL